MWGIFDGHGGKQVSEHCAETFPLLLKKEIAKGPSDLYQVLENSFLDVDKMLTMIDSNHCGSTAVVAVFRKEGQHNVLYVANAGDSRAVLDKNGQA